MVMGSAKHYEEIPSSIVFDPQPADNKYPLANTSLWAAAGLASYAMMIKNTDDGVLYYEPALQEAELAMAYADLAEWNSTFGVYTENFQGESPRPILANTQIVALLACARLYQATGKSSYLAKADTIINSLNRYFFVSGTGGVKQKLGSTFESAVYRGYDNALLAYALFQLGVATGSSVKNVKEYILGRPTNEYTNMGLDVMTFMNNYMWKKTGGDMAGYVEWVNMTMDSETDGAYSSYTNVRLSTTNMLTLYCLGETIVQTQAWYQYYQDYLIYTAIALGVILFVAILVQRRSSEGTKLPKVVKGLLGGED